MKDSYIAIFSSARKVILADDICMEQGIKSTVIHVPKEFSSECGMCLRLDEISLAKFEALMSEEGLEYELHRGEF